MWFNILSVSFLLNGCTTISSFHKKSKVVEIENDTLIEFNSTNLSKDSILIGYENLVLVGDITKHFSDATKAELEQTKCDKWVLTPQDLNGIMKIMKKVEASEWNKICYTYPCFYTGHVKNDKTVYEITINSGSYIQFTNSKETIYFVSTKKIDLFLTPCDCCE
jgi:hypothetical protein